MTDITVHLGRKISDGNFGSFDVQFFLTDSVRPGEKAPDAFERIYDLVESKLIEKTQPLLDR